MLLTVSLLGPGVSIAADATVPAAPSEDIRDIRGPKALAGESWLVPAVIAAVVVIAGAIWFIRQRRRRGAPARVLTLSEQALEALEAARSLLRPDTAREFGIAASEIIRDYIQKRFEVVATQRTTEEFLQGLLHNPNQGLANHRALLERFLQQCDLVKFAGASLAMADLESLLQSARTFVQQTAGQTPT